MPTRLLDALLDIGYALRVSLTVRHSRQSNCTGSYCCCFMLAFTGLSMPYKTDILTERQRKRETERDRARESE